MTFLIVIALRHQETKLPKRYFCKYMDYQHSTICSFPLHLIFFQQKMNYFENLSYSIIHFVLSRTYKKDNVLGTT